MKNMKQWMAATCMVAASFSAFADDKGNMPGTTTTTDTMNNMTTETTTPANLVGASDVDSVSFSKGQISLSMEEKKELREWIGQTGAKNIDEVKVLVWSDNEYPANDKQATEADIKLADKRGEAIKSYLKKDLNVGDVDIHNMAKRPNEISRFFKTDDYDLKAGATRSTYWTNHGGPSKSIVMIIPEKK